MMRAHGSLVGAAALSLASCTVGPDYHTPSVPITDFYKEVTPADFRTAGKWEAARPNDALPREKWWTIFGDPKLDAMEDELTASNQDLKVAEARFREARAVIGIEQAGESPSLTVGGTINSLKESAHQPYVLLHNPHPEGLFQLPFDLSYEVDLWGRIHRAVAAAREEAQATAGDLRDGQSQFACRAGDRLR
jgi:outer membrane protein TolC